MGSRSHRAAQTRRVGYVNQRRADIVGGIAALCLVVGFVSGLFLAFGTMNWPWLILSLICWIILAG